MRSGNGVSALPAWIRELVLVTGKGGVGKTTVAAAIAAAAHHAGKRVLLADVSSDATTRSQVLEYFGHGNPKSEDPFEIRPKLHGVRIMPSIGHKLFLREALRVRLLVDTAMKSAALNRFLMAAPTFPEIGTLYQLVQILRAKRFDHIVLDLPATGHALGLASLPKTVLKVLPQGLIGNAIREGLDAMTDPKRGSGVIVTLPEHMPVTEALELASGLEKLQIPIGAMVLNRMPPNPFSDDERKALDAHIRQRSGSMLLGAREFRRLERALQAQRMFRAMVPHERQIEVSLLNDRDPMKIIGHVEAALT
jgi:anion-transporting  ArsA/GET3 family ATPase